MERVEFLRDTRHLAGRPASTSAPPPQRAGLAVARRWDAEGAPVLIVATPEGTLVRLDFRARIRLLVAPEAYCVGRQEAGAHIPCPNRLAADRFGQCSTCHPLPERDCVFDPRCTDCTLEFCTGPHEVYLAFYGTSVKVGMTRGARGGDRLIEQGADAWTRAATVMGRKQARDMEDRITHLVGIPQSVAARTILPQRAHPVPWDAIEAGYDRLAARLQATTGSEPGALVRLPGGRGLPLPEPPVPVPAVGHHDGTTIGGKGRHLFYRGQGDVLRALDVDRVVTHAVRYHPEDAQPG